jgi:DNA-binding NtrC family response regulator
VTSSDDLRTGPISILLIHPKPLIQERLGQVLRAEGYHVRVVGSGSDAIAIVRRHKIDAALLDISGSFERIPAILTALRLELPQLPVILLAENARPETIASALHLSALTVLPAPYDIDILITLLRHTLTSGPMEVRAEKTEQRPHEHREAAGSQSFGDDR